MWAMTFAAMPVPQAQEPPADRPAYTSAGELLKTENYREWVYLSSGLGMTYGPAAANAAERPPMFTNVLREPGLLPPVHENRRMAGRNNVRSRNPGIGERRLD